MHINKGRPNILLGLKQILIQDFVNLRMRVKFDENWYKKLPTYVAFLNWDHYSWTSVPVIEKIKKGFIELLSMCTSDAYIEYKRIIES